MHLLANVSIGRDSLMLLVMSSCLLVMSSCRLCMVLSCLLVMLCFRHILLKKAGLDFGLWTLDSGPPPQTKKCCEKITQNYPPLPLLKFCRKKKKKCFCGQTCMSMRDIDRCKKHLPHIARFYQFLLTPG